MDIVSLAAGGTLVPDGYRARVVDSEMERALRAAGFVVLEGPRACGKTWTGLRFARSAVRLDTDFDARMIGAVEPSTLLAGPSPRLLDEWQIVPTVWNHVRHACDATNQRGVFILAGSAQPADDITRHTGAGRVRRIRMRPMSLFESADSSGEVSLTGLLKGESCRAGASKAGIRGVANVLCRGGWPGQIGLQLPEVQQNLRDYLAEVARTDIARLDGGVSHNPAGIERLLRSLARNTASEARNSTLAADVEPEPLHRHTVRSYLETLRRLFVVEEQPAWSVRLRSRAPLRRSPKWHYADPSLAAAALGADPDRLLADASTLGVLFESLVVRDLRILAQPLNGRVFHMRDASGLEADAIIDFPDGRWLAAEAKLGGGDAIDAAARSLLRLSRKVSAERAGQLAALVVITAVGYGYTRPDGVRVAPLSALGP
ncbi:MAG: ATP-binding protein [Acidimicrobiia bacterium]|nr:ATP-binding protein [Acidimicrobiia bacterium]